MATDSGYAHFPVGNRNIFEWSTPNISAGSQRPIQRAITSALGSDFVDDFDWQFVFADGLHVKDAWAMATAWASQLEGHVEFHADVGRIEFSIVPNYEWIRLRFGCCEGSSTAAYATSQVWRALAACRGYGAHENTTFWTRLVHTLKSQFGERRCQFACQDKCVIDESDAYRFFEGVGFPRFMLKPSSRTDDSTNLYDPDIVDHNFRVCCGLETDNSELSGHIPRQVSVYLDKLNPLVQAVRLGGPMELSLDYDVVNLKALQMNRLIADINGNRSISGRSRIHTSYRYCVREVGPRSLYSARLCQQDRADWETNAGRRAGGGGMTMMLPVPTVWIPTRGMRVASVADRVQLMKLLRWSVCAVDGSPPSTVRSLVSVHQHERFSLPAICSAMPHTRSVEVFQVRQLEDEDDDADPPISDSGVAWLGYALFHPDSATSAWRKLSIWWMRFASGSLRVRQVLEMMTKGNNLRVALGLSDVVVSEYFTATLRAGSVIYNRPGHVEAVVEVLQEATQLDVCVASTDLAALGEWVLVVVPGYAETWVRRDCIEAIVARPPGRPFLTGLKFECCWFDREIVLTFVKLAGGALTFLDLKNFGDSDNSLSVLTDWCPRLESLSVDGSISALMGWQLPWHLRELHIRSSSSPPKPTEFSMTGFDRLRGLTKFRWELDVYTFVVSPLILPLLRVLRRLKRLDSITRVAYFKELNLNYAMQRHITRVMLDGLERGGDDVGLGDGALPASIVALMSVVQRRFHRSEEDAIARPVQELVKLIRGFVGTPFPRAISVGVGVELTYTWRILSVSPPTAPSFFASA